MWIWLGVAVLYVAADFRVDMLWCGHLFTLQATGRWFEELDVWWGMELSYKWSVLFYRIEDHDTPIGEFFPDVVCAMPVSGESVQIWPRRVRRSKDKPAIGELEDHGGHAGGGGGLHHLELEDGLVDSDQSDGSDNGLADDDDEGGAGDHDGHGGAEDLHFVGLLERAANGLADDDVLGSLGVGLGDDVADPAGVELVPPVPMPAADVPFDEELEAAPAIVDPGPPPGVGLAGGVVGDGIADDIGGVPPPRNLKPGDVTIGVWGGRITYYASKTSFEATCSNRDHGKCVLTRTVKARRGGGDIPRGGRPLGMMLAWLHFCDVDSKAEHWERERWEAMFSHELRGELRGMVQALPNGPALLACERACADGELVEPELLEGYV